MNATHEKSGILPITQAGDPILSHRIEEFTAFGDPKEIARINSLGKNMLNTAHHFGLQGLSAPQVSESVRMFVLTVHATPFRPHITDNISLIIVNPLVLKQDSETESDIEGCGSIPGLYAEVPRPRSIAVRYHYFISPSELIAGDSVLSGFSARVFLHELDHLHGLPFLARVTDWSTLYTERELPRYYEKKKASEHLHKK